MDNNLVELGVHTEWCMLFCSGQLSSKVGFDNCEAMMHTVRILCAVLPLITS